MPDSTISNLTELSSPSNNDLIHIVDVDDSTFAASGTNKKITVANLLASASVDSIGEISDVTITSAASGELLKWNGSAWVNNTLAEAGIATASDYVQIAGDTMTGNLLINADVMIGGVTDPDTWLHVRNNPTNNYGQVTIEGISNDDSFISFQDSSAGITSHVGTYYNADSSGTHDTILANLDGGSIKLRTGADNTQSGLTTQVEITSAGAVHIIGSYTDASNYERMNLSADGAGTCTIAAETLGTGTDDVDIHLKPAGDGRVKLGTKTQDVVLAHNDVDAGYDLVARIRSGWSSPELYFADPASTQGAYFSSEVNQSQLFLYFGNSRSLGIGFQTDGVRPIAADDNQIDLGSIAQRWKDVHAGGDIVGHSSLITYGAYTDASNYERVSISADGAGTVTLAAETLGTGTDDVDIQISPAGNGVFKVSNATNPILTVGPEANSSSYVTIGNGTTAIGSSGSYITLDTPWGDVDFMHWGGLLKLDGAGLSTFAVSGGIHTSSNMGFSTFLNGVTQAEIVKTADQHLSLTGGGAGNACQLSIGGTTALATLTAFGAYTDASNYEGFSIDSDGAGTITLAAETLGTGTDNVDIDITPAGTGEVVLGGDLNLNNQGTRYISGMSSVDANRKLAIDSNGNISGSGYTPIFTGNVSGLISGTDYVVAASAGNNSQAGVIGGASRTAGYGGELLCYGYGHVTYPGAFRLQGAPGMNADGYAAGDCLVKGVTANASATTNIVGGDLYIEGGDGSSGSVGAAHGGDVYISGGTGYGTGIDGKVIIDSVLNFVDDTVSGSPVAFEILQDGHTNWYDVATLANTVTIDPSATEPLQIVAASGDDTGLTISSAVDMSVLFGINSSTPEWSVDYDTGLTVKNNTGTSAETWNFQSGGGFQCVNGGLGVHGVTVPAQASHIADPSGGATVDSEARAAINAILVVLENIGFTSTS